MPETQSSHITKLRTGGGCITVSIHGNKAVFSELSSTYPLKLLSPSIQDTRAVAYLLTYGGGLVSGDEITLVVNVQLGATLILLSQVSIRIGDHVCYAFHLPAYLRDQPRSSKRVRERDWLPSKVITVRPLHYVLNVMVLVPFQRSKTLTFT